jgi:hypothetical protein
VCQLEACVQLGFHPGAKHVDRGKCLRFLPVRQIRNRCGLTYLVVGLPWKGTPYEKRITGEPRGARSACVTPCQVMT